MVRLSKIVMVKWLGLFAAIVTFNNITDYGSNFEFVRHVLSMDTTFPDNKAMYRAITMPALWHAGYWLIIAGEALTAVLFGWGAWQMWAARRADSATFHRAKRLVAAGAMAGFMVWFGGFMVVGGEWFLMWQSQIWNGQQAAFRFYITILAVLIYVMQPDPEPWD